MGNDTKDIPNFWAAGSGSLVSVLGVAASLEVLNLNVFADEELWSTISRLPRLTKLSIPVASAFNSDPAKLHTFAVLSQLELYSPTLTLASLALRASSFPSVCEFKFHFTREPDREDLEDVVSSDVRDFVDAVVIACSTRQLCSFEVDRAIPAWVGWEELEEFIKTEVFRPLLQCTNMRRFGIFAGWYMDADDEFLRQVAEAWPKIEYLTLDASEQWPHISRITLKGLEPLAIHCPQLKTLAVVINCDAPLSESDTNATAQGHPQRQTALQELGVGGSRVASPEDVALYLSTRFANLSTIWTYKYADMLDQFWDPGVQEEDADTVQWRRVQQSLRTISTARVKEQPASLSG